MGQTVIIPDTGESAEVISNDGEIVHLMYADGTPAWWPAASFMQPAAAVAEETVEVVPEETVTPV